MIRVLIADDHAVVRKGLRHILSAAGDIQVVDEASAGAEVINLIGRKIYDLVLLDTSMPGRNGLDILRQIKSMKPKLPVLILSMHAEEDYGSGLRRARRDPGASAEAVAVCRGVG